jgi:hypothetical protein
MCNQGVSFTTIFYFSPAMISSDGVSFSLPGSMQSGSYFINLMSNDSTDLGGKADAAKELKKVQKGI